MATGDTGTVIRYSEYRAAYDKAVSALNTTGATYTWRYAPSGIGAIITADAFNELKTAIDTAHSQYSVTGCTNNHNVRYDSDYDYGSYSGGNSQSCRANMHSRNSCTSG